MSSQHYAAIPSQKVHLFVSVQMLCTHKQTNKQKNVYLPEDYVCRLVITTIQHIAQPANQLAAPLNKLKPQICKKK